MAVCVLSREKGGRALYFHRKWAFMAVRFLPKPGHGCDKWDVWSAGVCVRVFFKPHQK